MSITVSEEKTAKSMPYLIEGPARRCHPRRGADVSSGNWPRSSACYCRPFASRGTASSSAVLSHDFVAHRHEPVDISVCFTSFC